MATPALGSILLASTDPDRLRAWYRAALAPDQSSEGPLDLGGVKVVFDRRSDIDDKNPEPGRAILNFHVNDARGVAGRMNEVGVSWLVEVEQRPAGLFGTLVDPDGNYIQIIEFNEAHDPSR